ncbi:MAG: type II secretion system protein [Streptosporangiales bacterium]|nr:type II secretion system protein [Streptosporangiales bacterium]
MTEALLAGAVIGLGLFALMQALYPSRPGLTRELAAYDAGRGGASRRESAAREEVGRLRKALGERMAAFYAARGWRLTSTRADLALLGRSFGAFLATKVLLAAGALVVAPLLVAWVLILQIGIPLVLPLWAALLLAMIFFFLPDLQLKQDAAARRRDFRHAVGAFLDLVAMNLAGGRGVPEALMAAAAVGDGWALWHIRDTLAEARITGRTPWEALGGLGEELGIVELRDLSAALALVADDGAKVRKSLSARAASLRRRELSEAEGKAGERSQSMLVAQLLLVAGFLVFLTYPALMRVMNA